MTKPRLAPITSRPFHRSHSRLPRLVITDRKEKKKKHPPEAGGQILHHRLHPALTSHDANLRRIPLSDSFSPPRPAPPRSRSPKAARLRRPRPPGLAGGRDALLPAVSAQSRAAAALLPPRLRRAPVPRPRAHLPPGAHSPPMSPPTARSAWPHPAAFRSPRGPVRLTLKPARSSSFFNRRSVFLSQQLS